MNARDRNTIAATEASGTPAKGTEKASAGFVVPKGTNTTTSFEFTIFTAPDGLRHRKQIAAECEPPPRKNFVIGRATQRAMTLAEFGRWLRSEAPKDLAFLTSGVADESPLKMGQSDARRTKETFPFPEGPALLCIDCDSLDTWGLDESADVVAALAEIGVECDLVTSSSASSYLKYPDGRGIGLKGLHVFAVIDDGREIPRVLEALHVRACNAGCGRILIAENGVMHVRSIVDQAMKTPSQPLFEWGAVLHGEGLTQERRVEFHGPGPGGYGSEGSSDSPVLKAADIPPLTDDEWTRFKAWETAEKARHATEAAKVRGGWLDGRVARLRASERPAARKRLEETLEKSHRDLERWFELTLDDGSTMTVAELVEAAKGDPDKWHRETLPDPFEPEYGRGHATVFCKDQKDGRVKILSMAHGQQVTYHLEPKVTADDFDELGAKVGGSRLAGLAALDRFNVSKEDVTNMNDAEFLIPNLIVRGHVHVFVAPPNGGKTTLFMHLCEGLAAQGLDVRYINVDTNPGDLKRHYAHAEEHGYRLLAPDAKPGLSAADVVHVLHVLCDEGVSLGDLVLIFDTAKKFTETIDKRQAKAFLGLMRSLSTRGATIALLHHTNKYRGADGRTIYEGTGDWRADADELIYLDGEKDEDGSLIVTTRPDKVRAPFSTQSFRIAFDDQGERSVTALGGTVPVIGEARDLVEAIKEAIREGQTSQKDICQAVSCKLSVPAKQVRETLLRFGEGDGRLWRSEKAGRGRELLYSLTQAEPEDFI
ncbi:MAG: AAA family ATPase [Rhodocyclaceae bacterium]|nr:AAA family ATPase [Rhodocyclaceae bacterium]